MIYFPDCLCLHLPVCVCFCSCLAKFNICAQQLRRSSNRDRKLCRSWYFYCHSSEIARTLSERCEGTKRLWLSKAGGGMNSESRRFRQCRLSNPADFKVDWAEIVGQSWSLLKKEKDSCDWRVWNLHSNNVCSFPFPVQKPQARNKFFVGAMQRDKVVHAIWNGTMMDALVALLFRRRLI